MNRRNFLGAASALLLTPHGLRSQSETKLSNPALPIFDGKTLNGWIPFENSWISFSSSSILDPAGLAKGLLNEANPVSASILSSLTDDQRKLLAPESSGIPDAKALASALARLLNQQINGQAFDVQRTPSQTNLRPETRALLAQRPKGVDLVRAKKMLLEDVYATELARGASAGWEVKDGAMASTGGGRGVIYTAADYSRFRLTFTMRHVSGKPDHQACVLIFCTRPQPGETPLDALGGIQFQVPNGGHWDYRVGMNQGGGAEFTTVQKSAFDIHSWSRVEILADASRGTARMAVAQPVGSKSVEVLDFHDPAAGRPGPIALQMHNAGLFDEYKDIAIEVNPAQDELLTTQVT
jgi:hypothetical protein